MSPETRTLLDDFLSRDPIRIWSASGAVRECNDRAVLAPLAEHQQLIAQATTGIELGGALRPNATHLAFALRKLAFVAHSDACLCALWLTDDLADPERAAKNGDLQISDTVINRAECYTDFHCKCAACGCRFVVQDVIGYHYKWWKWVLA